MFFNTEAYAKLYPRTEAKEEVKTPDLAVEEPTDTEEKTVEEVKETVEDPAEDPDTGEEEA